MSTWPNPDLRRKLERQVRALASAILDGREPLVPSTPRMMRLLYRLRVPNEDPAMRTFTGISSETTHLPIGSERQYWAPEALARKDREIAQVEEWAREDGRAACRHLLALFPPVPPAR